MAVENYTDNCGEFVFQKSTSKNMDKLWTFFHAKENYPEYYLGISKKVAVCKCPITGKDEWFHLSDENPTRGSMVSICGRDFIFVGWLKQPIHKWRMKNGKTLQLEQSFVDGLLPEDKRYLKINA